MEIVAYKGRPFSVFVDEFLSHFALDSAMWLICIFIKNHKNTTNRTYVVCPYCSSSQRSAVVFSAHPALDEQEVLFCITETHIHLQRKIGFGKPKILVTVFQVLKCERTGTCTSTRIRSLSCAEPAQKEKNVRRIHP